MFNFNSKFGFWNSNFWTSGIRNSRSLKFRIFENSVLKSYLMVVRRSRRHCNRNPWSNWQYHHDAKLRCPPDWRLKFGLRYGVGRTVRPDYRWWSGRSLSPLAKRKKLWRSRNLRFPGESLLYRRGTPQVGLAHNLKKSGKILNPVFP